MLNNLEDKVKTSIVVAGFMLSMFTIYKSAQKASEIVDMLQVNGKFERFGLGIDSCPFIENVTENDLLMTDDVHYLIRYVDRDLILKNSYNIYSLDI